MKSELFNEDYDLSQIREELERETKEELEKKKTFLDTFKKASTKALIKELLRRNYASGNDYFRGVEYMQKKIIELRTEFDALHGLLIRIQNLKDSSDDIIESRISNAGRSSSMAYYSEHQGRNGLRDENLEPPTFMPKPEDLI